MIKISLCILAVYLIYYASNILYDLFLRKEKTVFQEESEEFSLSDISGHYDGLTQNVGIEDVENIITPKSFNKRELINSVSGEQSEERQDLELLRVRFESEQDIDQFENNEEETEVQTKISDTLPDNNEEDIATQNIKETAYSDRLINIDKFRDLLNLAETSVQLISHQDGYKIYQSIM